MLIGLAGKARSGKDTVASYLRDNFGFVTVAVADKFKRLFMDIYGLTAEQVHGDLKEVVDPRYGVTPRYIMQYVGHNFRHIWPDVWVWHLRQQLSSLLRDGGMKVAVTDIRQANEARMIKDLGGYLIKVERQGAKANNGIEGHVTEVWVDTHQDWDLVIYNDSSFTHLYEQVEEFYRKVRG